MNYQQAKANAATNTLSLFFRRSQSVEEKLRAENTQILHRLYSSLSKISLSSLSLSGHNTGSQAKNLLPLYQVLICGTYILPMICQFGEELRRELAGNRPYQQACIADLRLQLSELKVEN